MGLSVDDIYVFDNQALAYMCFDGHLDTLRYLIDQGLSIVGRIDNTTLGKVCANGHLDMARFLLNDVIELN